MLKKILPLALLAGLAGCDPAEYALTYTTTSTSSAVQTIPGPCGWVSDGQNITWQCQGKN